MTRRPWAATARPGRCSASRCSYTMAYAFSITRYKLMQVEEIINRSVGLLRLQRDGGPDLLGRAPGQRHG